MTYFTESRRIINLRRCLQDLKFIDLIPEIQEWIKDSEDAIIQEARQIEKRNSRYVSCYSQTQ